MAARAHLTAVGWIVCLVAAACSGSPETPGSLSNTSAPIVVVGDSFFEWNRLTGESIPDAIGEVLGRPVYSAAVGGAHFTGAGRGATEIRSQDRPANHSWVVVAGGVNDLHDDCGCEFCAGVLDGLVSSDGRTGEIPQFARRLAADGTRVMLVGYYLVPEDAEGGFGRCVDEVAEQTERLRATANAIDGVWFVSAADVVDADDATAHAADGVHPSPRGSRLVGEHIATAIAAAETESAVAPSRSPAASRSDTASIEPSAKGRPRLGS